MGKDLPTAMTHALAIRLGTCAWFGLMVTYMWGFKGGAEQGLEFRSP